MRNGEWSKLFKVAGRILLAFLFVFSQSAWASQDPKAQDNPKSAQKAATRPAGEKPFSAATTPKPQTSNVQREESEEADTQEKPSGDGKHEGIKVHGHWTIEVRNPDGTLVTHHEFENSLSRPTGSAQLLSLISRSGATGSWDVQLWGNTGTGLCTNGLCEIVENTMASTVPRDSNNLILTVPGSGNNVTQMNLSGSVVVTSAGSIAAVQTNMSVCPGSTSPQACATSLFGSLLAFTYTNISPISVAAGQTVAVNVIISFS